MTGLNRSVMMYHRLLALSFLMVTTVFFATSCKSSKKKSSAGGGGAPPTTSLEGDLTGDNCAAELTTVAPLPSASLTSLNLASADIENASVGSYKTAKVVLKLASGSDQPDRCIYYACLANDKSSCVLGSTASCEEYNPNLPEGAINLTAWACVRPERVDGYPGSLSNYANRKVMVDQETFYCGDPVTHYDNKNKNSYESDSIGQMQSLIKDLEDRRVRFGMNIVNIVKQYVANNQSSITSTDSTWVNIANLGDLSGETIALLYADAKSATETAQNTSAGSGSGLTAESLKLSNGVNGEPCIPLPDPSVVSNSSTGFSPPSPVTIPSTPSVGTETNDPGITDPGDIGTTEPDPVTNSNETTTVAAQDFEAKCKQRSEWFESQNLGSTIWNKELNRCFHVKADGKQTEIDVSIDPDQLASSDGDFEEVQDTDEEPGMSGWQKTGAAMMAIGGIMGVAGGVGYFYAQNQIKKGGGKNPGTSSPTLKPQDELITKLNDIKATNIESSKSALAALRSDYDTKFTKPIKDVDAKIRAASQLHMSRSGTLNGKTLIVERVGLNTPGRKAPFVSTPGPLGSSVTIDDVNNKVTYEVRAFPGNIKKQIVIDGPEAVETAKKLQAAVDGENRAIAAIMDPQTGKLKPDMQKYANLDSVFRGKGMPDNPAQRSAFLTSLSDQEKIRYQEFLDLESEWRPKREAVVDFQRAGDISSREFVSKHVVTHSDLGLDLNSKQRAIDKFELTKQRAELEISGKKAYALQSELEFRSNLHEQLKNGSLPGPDRQRLELARTEFDDSWTKRVSAGTIAADSVGDSTSKVSKGNWFEKIKSDPVKLKDTSMKGGLIGIAAFAIGGLMSTGVLGLAEGSNLTNLIVNDPNFQRNIRDMEMANSLIEGLQKSSSAAVFSEP